MVSVSPTIGSSQDSGDGEFVSPFLVVMYAESDAAVLRPLAEQVAKHMGASLVQPAARNPVCCVWLELTHWKPNPGKAGYVIINQPGGSVIYASDAQAMQSAVKRFVASSRRRQEKIEVPIGLLTNFPVAQ